MPPLFQQVVLILIKEVEHTFVVDRTGGKFKFIGVLVPGQKVNMVVLPHQEHTIGTELVQLCNFQRSMNFLLGIVLLWSIIAMSICYFGGQERHKHQCFSFASHLRNWIDLFALYLVFDRHTIFARNGAVDPNIDLILSDPETHSSGS